MTQDYWENLYQIVSTSNKYSRSMAYLRYYIHLVHNYYKIT